MTIKAENSNDSLLSAYTWRQVCLCASVCAFAAFVLVAFVLHLTDIQIRIQCFQVSSVIVLHCHILRYSSPFREVDRIT